MADLGFSHFYFSCKNYLELAQIRITKVVAVFTTNPTKLGLHFSDFPTIFMEFTNFSQSQTLFMTQHSQGSLELFSHSQRCPRFTLRTLEIFQTSQLGPWDQWRRQHRWDFWLGEVWKRCRGSP
jgi:hypothetical protein